MKHKSVYHQFPFPLLPPPSPALLRDENTLTSKLNSAKQLLALTSASQEPEQICPCHWPLVQLQNLAIDKRFWTHFSIYKWKNCHIYLYSYCVEAVKRRSSWTYSWVWNQVGPFCFAMNVFHSFWGGWAFSLLSLWSFSSPISVENVVKRLSMVSLG